MIASLGTIASRRPLVIGALVFWVFAARLWLIKAGGSIVPFWDQWGAEAIALYRPWLDGTFDWSHLFAPHNEHRIALTRLADLLLFEASGGWNPWNQMLLNAALHAAVASALAALFWSSLAPIPRAIFVAVLALVFGAPAGWQNALWGFQSQVYFANVLSVGAIAGLCGSIPLSTRWWGGLLAAFLALFANAGGLLASVAALVVNAGLLFQYTRSPGAGKCGGSTPLSTTRLDAFSPSLFLSLLILAAVVALGLFLRVDVPHHTPLQARTLSQFFAVFVRCLAWPLVNQPWAAVVMQLPLLCLIWDHIRRRDPLSGVARCAVALGMFAALHAAAVAYSRGAGLPEFRPLSRYQDPLLLGVTAQIFAGLTLVSRYALKSRLLMIIWIGTLACGLVHLTEINLLLNLPYKQAHDAASLANIRDYSANGDPTTLARRHGFGEQLEEPEMMRQLLDDPTMMAVLPASLFVPDIAEATRHPWIIRAGRELAAMAALALLVAVAAAVTPNRRRR